MSRIAMDGPARTPAQGDAKRHAIESALAEARPGDLARRYESVRAQT